MATCSGSSPGPAFPGLAPGQSVTIEYLTSPSPTSASRRRAPTSSSTSAPDRGYPLKDYVAVPFERPPQQGRDPRVVTPQAQYALDEAARDVAPRGPAPVFPTPLSVRKGEGELRLADACPR